MAVPLSWTLWMGKMVWLAISGWVFSCLNVADEIASSLRTGEIGPFHVGWIDRLIEEFCAVIKSHNHFFFGSCGNWLVGWSFLSLFILSPISLFFLLDLSCWKSVTHSYWCECYLQIDRWRSLGLDRCIYGIELNTYMIDVTLLIRLLFLFLFSMGFVEFVLISCWVSIVQVYVSFLF